MRDFRLQMLADRPTDSAGRPLCLCGAALGDTEWLCAPCQTAATERRQREERDEELGRWRSAVGAPLRTFPAFPHARCATAEFAAAVQDPRLRHAAEHYSPELGPLVLAGPTGVGKTTAAVAVAHRIAGNITARLAACQRKSEWAADPAWVFLRSARFVRAAELARAVRGHPLGQGDAPELQAAFGASWLVLDDLGNEPAGFEKTVLELADHRYVQRLPTLVTSGFTRSQIAGRYGDALLRRWVEPVGAILDLWERGRGRR